ncbi:hypothetical protein ABPG74_011538 [Tetrahymena malaccensis]
MLISKKIINKFLSFRVMQQKSSIQKLQFLNLAFNSLPVEENKENTPRQVRGAFYSKVNPKVRKNPKIVSLSESALNLLDLTKEEVLQNEKESAEILTGNLVPSNAQPIAHCYCGHQFGSWAAQLGDGRAISYGDIRNSKGEIVELQLKGSGVTPYSRFADGNAVLRSSIREYLCSEAMHYLNIPTTRAASITITDDQAMRDPLYNQQVVNEKCAVVLRLSPTFIRFGSFQICNKQGPSEGLGEQMIPELLDFIIKHHYPELDGKEDKYLLFIQEITKRTAQLVAKWQSVGFCHGVLNTDNMSIVGVTIDYGPFGFMEHFDKKHICNHSDKEGYYCYQNQPSACKWNILRLIEGIKWAVNEEQAKEYVIQNFDKIYYDHYYILMRRKIGLFREELYEKNLQLDKRIINNLMDFMDSSGSEFTNFFRKLSQIKLSKDSIDENGNAKIEPSDQDLINELLSFSASKDSIIERSKPFFDESQLFQIKSLQQSNPMVLAMKGITEKFIQEQEEKLEKYFEIKDLSEEDFRENNESTLRIWFKLYKKRLAEEIQGENINFDLVNQERKQKMDSVNPAVVLRNYMAQQVIEQAEKGDYSGIDKLLNVLSKPFEDVKENDQEIKICKITPGWASKLCVSCSS